MFEMTLLGLGLLLIMVTWKFMLKPSLLDSTRDQLFDLRESVREHYIKTGKGLSDPSYVALRNLLNAHLRFTEQITFLRVIFAITWRNEHAEAFAAMHRDFDKTLEAQSAETQKYVQGVRLNASVAMLDYAAKSSLLGWTCIAIGGVIGACMKISQACSVRTLSPAGAFLHVAAWLGAIAVTPQLSATVTGRNTAQAVMEECALHARAV